MQSLQLQCPPAEQHETPAASVDSHEQIMQVCWDETLACTAFRFPSTSPTLSSPLLRLRPIWSIGPSVVRGERIQVPQNSKRNAKFNLKNTLLEAVRAKRWERRETHEYAQRKLTQRCKPKNNLQEKACIRAVFGRYYHQVGIGCGGLGFGLVWAAGLMFSLYTTCVSLLPHYRREARRDHRKPSRPVRPPRWLEENSTRSSPKRQMLALADVGWEGLARHPRRDHRRPPTPARPT